MSKGTRLEGNTIGFEQKPIRSLRHKLGSLLMTLLLSVTGVSSDRQQFSNPECNKLEGSVVPGDHGTDLVNTRPMPDRPIPPFIGPLTYTGNYIRDQLGTDPQLYTEKFAITYLERLATILGITTTDIVLDPSLGLSNWSDNISDRFDQMDTAQALANIITQIVIYNPKILQRFDIDRIRLANIYQDIAGHYSPQDHEILLDFGGGRLKDWEVYRVMIHELAHAYHNKFCNGIQNNDPEISNYNSIGYVGYQKNNPASSGEGGGNDIPQELYQYGLRREFVNDYAMSSVQEDFATTVAWSFVKRGIIMPGDADYKSPLYYKQQIIIDRLEQMIPGSREFLGKLTILLRLKNDNEIYSDQDLPKVEVEVPKLLDLLNSQRQGIMGEPPEDPIVLNALQASWSYPNLFYPDISFNAVPEAIQFDVDSGEIIIIPAAQYPDDYYRFYVKRRSPEIKKGPDLVVYVRKRDVVNGQYVGDDLFGPESQSSMPTQQNLSIEDFMNGGKDYRLLTENGGWTPVIIVLVY